MDSDEDTGHENGWEDDQPYHLGEWPKQDDMPAWIMYGMKLLANEVYCTIQHLTRGEREEREDGRGQSDFVDAAMHLTNVVTGLKELTQALFDELLTDREKVGVTMLVMERQLGIPMKVVDTGVPGVVTIVPDQIVVAGTVDDLLRGESGGDEE